MPTKYGFILASATLSLLVYFPATAALGDKGNMLDACNGTDVKLTKLCQIAKDRIHTPGGEYVHLGGDVFLLSVDAIGRVAEGVYIANVKAGRLNMFNGYGSPTLGAISRGKGDSIWINVTKSSMSRGQFWETSSILQRRWNPMSKMPYLIGYTVRGVTGLSEEMEGFCSKSENKQNADCAGIGETRYMTQEDVEHFVHDSYRVTKQDTDRILAAHREAVQLSKSTKFEGKSPFQVLEEAGVRRILDHKPNTMTTARYAQVMNDFAFFAYQYGEGRTDLAIEILEKVLKLSPNRAVAYLNMSQALEYLARFGATEYATVPLDSDTILRLRETSKIFMRKYEALLERRR